MPTKRADSLKASTHSKHFGSSLTHWPVLFGAILLTVALSKTHGSFHEIWIWALPACLGLFAVSFFGFRSQPENLNASARPANLALFVVCGCLLAAFAKIIFFGIPNQTLPANHEYYEPSRAFLFDWIRGLNGFAALSAIACLIASRFSKVKSAETLFYLTVFAIGVSLLLDLSLSPRPWIDVWTVHEDAVASLLRFENPYSQTYASVYPKSLEESFLPFGVIFIYLPGVLYLMAPFKLLGLDVRVALVFAHIASALLLKAIAQKQNSRLGTYAVSLLFLALPFTPYLMLMGWNDTFTLLFVLFCAYSLATKSPRFFFVSLLGLALIKPHIALVLPLLLWHGCRRLQLPVLRTFTLLVGAGLLLCAPFLISDWRNFLGSQYGLHFLRGTYSKTVPERLDSFNLLYFLKYRWDFTLPYLTPLVALGSWAVVLWRLGKSPTLTQVFLGAGISLLALFIFAPAAFLNYYWVVLGFIYASLALQPFAADPANSADTVPLDSARSKRQTARHAAI